MPRRKKVYDTVEEWLDALTEEERQRLYWRMMLEDGWKQMNSVDLAKEVSAAC